ncbi:MAG: hypothetical protein DWQ36_00865 [Acidobacteria bacterium]|nr:MAG: hypothetical protein DWQ30_08970 [Acidobacteriota bacterium]REK11809.1 MAG: hypothetical protein DWQ36_00865 [Acidobacteriota bacterium]
MALRRQRGRGGGLHVRAVTALNEAATSPLPEAAGSRGGTRGGTREKVRGQGSGVRGQGSGVRGQGSGVRGQGSGVRGQGSGVRGQGSGRGIADPVLGPSSGISAAVASFRLSLLLLQSLPF